MPNLEYFNLKNIFGIFLAVFHKSFQTKFFILNFKIIKILIMVNLFIFLYSFFKEKYFDISFKIHLVFFLR